MMSIIGTPFYAPQRYQYSAEATYPPLFGFLDDMHIESSFCAPRQHHYSAEPTYLSLFRLLDDHFSDDSRDAVAQQPKRRRQSPAPIPRFNPRFNIRETDDAYELHAELAGIEKENLEIQFTGSGNIQIHGRIVEPTEEEQPASEQEVQPEMTEPAAAEPKKRSKRYQATVEDDTEDSWTEASSTGSWTPISSPKPEQAKPASAEEPKKSADVQKAVFNNKTEAAQKKKNADKVIGEFSREFEFPTDVNQDGVNATLEDGRLTVVVPKKAPSWRRRIPVM